MCHVDVYVVTDVLDEFAAFILWVQEDPSELSMTIPTCMVLYSRRLNFHEHCCESLKSSIYYFCFHICCVGDAMMFLSAVSKLLKTLIYLRIFYSYPFVKIHISVFSNIGAVNHFSWKTVITLHNYFRCITNLFQ
jgi:hypothetical protein